MMKIRKIRYNFKNAYRYGKYIKYHYKKRTCKNIKHDKNDLYQKMAEE